MSETHETERAFGSIYGPKWSSEKNMDWYFGGWDKPMGVSAHGQLMQRSIIWKKAMIPCGKSRIECSGIIRWYWKSQVSFIAGPLGIKRKRVESQSRLAPVFFGENEYNEKKSLPQRPTLN